MSQAPNVREIETTFGVQDSFYLRQKTTTGKEYEPKARLQQKIEEVDARPLAEVYERTRKRKVNDQSSPLGERWSVVNLSFSFRTPSTSSYLLVGVNEREDRRLPTVDSRTRVTVG